MNRDGASRSLAVLLALVGGASSCVSKPAPPVGVVLITLDTTRADHLGCYGDASAATPNLDAFSKEAVRFDQAMAAVPTTLASHSTMFTGEYPPVHGVRYNGMFTLGDASVTIAERFRDAGFKTGAVPAAYPVFAKSGLAQGFDTYRDIFSEPGADQLPSAAERKAEAVTRLGLETIRAAGKKRFFVWLHYYDAHYPYEPPFPFSSRFREHPYDGEIAYVDAQLGVLFAALRAEGLWDRIVVIVAGDHGEGLYEHGERMHAQLAYQTTLRVPLLVKAPGAKPGIVVAEPVSLADIAPTILDLAGLPIPAGLDGTSLREALRGREPARRALYFETLAGSLSFGWSPIEGVRRGKWKLIRSSDPELFDLDSDPAETNNLYASEGTVAPDLQAAVDKILARGEHSEAPAQALAAPLDPAALTRLASLGYVGGTVGDTHRGGPSPRSMAHLESELLLLQDDMLDHRYREALVSAGNILRDDPGNRLALNGAADASAELRDLEGAKRYGRELLARYPEFVPGVVTQGRIEVAEKDYKSAESIFRSGLEKSPGAPVLVYSLAMTLIAQKRPGEARPLVDKALQAPRPDPAFFVLLAVCRAATGDGAGAKTALEQAIAAGYTNVDTLRTEPLLAPLRRIPGFEQALTSRKAS
jgi:arylsulfatase A-like enzyme/Flp pilus assembly protein TadD